MVVQGSRFREEWAMTSFTFTVLPTISHLTVRTLPSREVKLPDVFWSATVSKPSALPKLLKRKKERHNKSVQKTLLGYFRKPKVDYTRDFWLNQFFFKSFFHVNYCGKFKCDFFWVCQFPKVTHRKWGENTLDSFCGFRCWCRSFLHRSLRKLTRSSQISYKFVLFSFTFF